MPAYSRILLPWDSQPQESVGVGQGFSAPVGFAYLPSVGLVNLANGQTANEIGTVSTSAIQSGIAYAGGKHGYQRNISLANGATFISIWRAGTQYGGADGSPRIISNQKSGSNGFSWGRQSAIGGGATGNLTQQRLTFHGIADYTEANNTIESYVDTPVACRYNKTTGAISWFRFGVQSSADTAGSTSPGSGFQIVVGGQGDFAGATQLWIDKAPALVVFEGALSDAEIFRLTNSVSAVWSLFAPRSIWVPVSASGAAGYTLTASPGAYTLSGQSATITRSRELTASPGSYTLSGQAATITRNRALTASSGAYTLSGQAATITRNRALTASSGAYTLSGQAATITYTPGTGTTYTLTADAGAYTLSGQVASLLYGRLLVASSGSYAVTGQDATITYTPAALPTVGRPASDASNSGWTASTGSDLYAMLDEVTPDSADYIVTTSTGSICEMPLQTTAYPGTSAQKLSYRASSSTGNSVIVRLKNTGGATVRTETQVLTASDTLYEITLTSGEIAAITSGALSVQLESA